jgi:hypothetical protein
MVWPFRLNRRLLRQAREVNVSEGPGGEYACQLRTYRFSHERPQDSESVWRHGHCREHRVVLPDVQHYQGHTAVELFVVLFRDFLEAHGEAYRSRP